MGSPWTGGQCFVHHREKEGCSTERKRGADNNIINCNGPKDYKERHATQSSYHVGFISLSTPLHIDYKDILNANKPVNICWASSLLFKSG